VFAFSVAFLLTPENCVVRRRTSFDVIVLMFAAPTQSAAALGRPLLFAEAMAGKRKPD